MNWEGYGMKWPCRRLVSGDTGGNNYKPESVQADSKQRIEIVTSRIGNMLTMAPQHPIPPSL
jgi:hypothetical protein